MLSNSNIETMDINILVSVVNMKLRNDYPSIDTLCSSFDVDQQRLIERLRKSNYAYSEEHNNFYYMGD